METPKTCLPNDAENLAYQSTPKEVENLDQRPIMYVTPVSIGSLAAGKNSGESQKRPLMEMSNSSQQNIMSTPKKAKVSRPEKYKYRLT